MPTKQVNFRLPDDVIATLDRLVDEAKSRGDRHPANRTEALIHAVDRVSKETPATKTRRPR